ncbi:innexin domain-containing protein [Ditylenchus destructor]|nr:innexin domain-containing protein [Ditylenchus destructor]
MNLLSSALTSIKPRKDDTIVDRLNYYYSSVIIIVMAITLTAKQYVGQPIQCWVPSEFSRAWEQYAENYCFVYNTYWVRPGEDIPQEVDSRTKRQLIYYQWVPFLMALEAGFFYLPMIFWSQTNGKSGINIANMVKTVEGTDTSENAERKKAVLAICHHLEDSVRLRYVRREGATKLDYYWKLGMLNGNFVSNMFIFTKLLYMVNIVGQFLMMNQFLGQHNHAWGANILHDIIEGRDWELSGNFPRISLCDFTVRTLSNVHRYSIQCVLVLNMFNEKIFLFLYWWLVLVGVMTFLDMIYWSVCTRISSRRIGYMKKFVRVSPDDDYIFREFCDKIINADGTMLLKMLGVHTNELFTQDVLKILWENYRAQTQLKHVFCARPVSRHSPSLAESLPNSDESFSYHNSPPEQGAALLEKSMSPLDRRHAYQNFHSRTPRSITPRQSIKIQRNLLDMSTDRPIYSMGSPAVLNTHLGLPTNGAPNSVNMQRRSSLTIPIPV